MPDPRPDRRGKSVGLGLLILLTAMALATSGCNPRNLIGWSSGWGATASSDGVVYVGTRQGMILALDSNEEGGLSPRDQLIWSFAPFSEDISLGGVFGAPAVGEDLIYVGSRGSRDGDTGRIYALHKDRAGFSNNLESGEWIKTLEGAIVGGPAIGEGFVLVGSDDGKLYAFDALTGERAGTFASGGRIWSPPAIANGVAYFGSMDRYVYAVSLDGRLNQSSLLWKYKTGGAVVSKPLLVDGPDGLMVVVGSFDKNVYALKAVTDNPEGQLAWDKPFKGSHWFWASAVSDGNLIFAATMDGSVYGLDKQGASAWPLPFKASEPVVSTPVVVGDVLIVATDAGKLHIISAIDGAKLEVSKDLNGRVKAPLSIDGNMVFVGVEDNTVRGVDVKGWQERWQVSTKDLGES